MGDELLVVTLSLSFVQIRHSYRLPFFVRDFTSFLLFNCCLGYSGCRIL